MAKINIVIEAYPDCLNGTNTALIFVIQKRCGAKKETKTPHLESIGIKANVSAVIHDSVNYSFVLFSSSQRSPTSTNVSDPIMISSHDESPMLTFGVVYFFITLTPCYAFAASAAALILL